MYCKFCIALCPDKWVCADFVSNSPRNHQQDHWTDASTWVYLIASVTYLGPRGQFVRSHSIFDGKKQAPVFSVFFSCLEDHPRTCKWLLTMVHKSPKRVVGPPRYFFSAAFDFRSFCCMWEMGCYGGIMISHHRDNYELNSTMECYTPEI